MPLPPDFLRRFTPTPYVFDVWANEHCIRIEAGDLEIALAIRQACRMGSFGEEEPTLYWRLIRDCRAPEYGAELSIFSTGELKTLLHQSGTLLIADRKRREVFGFIGPGLDMRQLTQSLLPQLMRHASSSGEEEPFTNK
jgi:hypothetical protein